MARPSAHTKEPAPTPPPPAPPLRRNIAAFVVAILCYAAWLGYLAMVAILWTGQKNP